MGSLGAEPNGTTRTRSLRRVQSTGSLALQSLQRGQHQRMRQQKAAKKQQKHIHARQTQDQQSPSALRSLSLATPTLSAYSSMPFVSHRDTSYIGVGDSSGQEVSPQASRRMKVSGTQRTPTPAVNTRQRRQKTAKRIQRVPGGGAYTPHPLRAYGQGGRKAKPAKGKHGRQSPSLSRSMVRELNNSDSNGSLPKIQ